MERKESSEGAPGESLWEVRNRRKSVKLSKLDWKKVRQIGQFGTEMTKQLDGVEVRVGDDLIEIWPATAAWFLGPKAENESLLRSLVEYTIQQHVEFRKYKYFPLDPNYITPSIQESESYIQAKEKLRTELTGLTSRLKNSVPFFNFRSQGHMIWDTTIASNVGYIAALLYNQNNVASMASGVTLQLEREVARELCSMVGYNVYDEDHEHTTEDPGSWGHLPNGGTVANLEAMWAARCLKFNALTLKKMMQELFEEKGLQAISDTFRFKNTHGEMVLLRDAGAWELLNLPVDGAIDLFDSLRQFIQQSTGITGCDETFSFEDLFACVKEYTLEELGGIQFYYKFKDDFEADQVTVGGKWFVPGSRHYSWDKGANILGIGRRNLIKIPVDKYCRMDTQQLRKELQQCLKSRTPVIGVTVVFGTTQEGAVDNLKEILGMRSEFEREGLTFYIHIDGAWGGYFASILRAPDISKKADTPDFSKTELFRRSTMFLQAKLSKHFLAQLSCMHEANSITLDPHKSGFCPYPAGGLLYRNGNIRKFLAQKAAYVNHGSGKNEEINLFGIDGSKPGAASAGVWLSHRVVGLHNEGYGLLLEQCTFSAGIMYSLWVSLERTVDPFVVVPAIPVLEEFKGWTKQRIRKQILQAENWKLQSNGEALKFINENGPDTLINCVSINFRTWNQEEKCWTLNKDLALQRKFVKNFYKRCSHSFERPNMVDRGIQIILNSTSWTKEGFSGSYTEMKKSLGLDEEDEGNISMIINTCMSPWLRAQKTFKRIGIIIRNELYNAHGSIFDEPEELHLVSPCIVVEDNWRGDIFAELEASFSNPSLRYHVIGRWMFPPADLEKIQNLAKKFYDEEFYTGKTMPLRIVTKSKMKVFELMTGGDEVQINQPRKEVPSDLTSDDESLGKKLEEYSEDFLQYEDIAMPEVDVLVYFGENENVEDGVETKIKLKRIIRYHHLTRDSVDEADYPPSQEYFLYTDNQVAYLSHCPNRWPDFQQQIRLDEIPRTTPAQHRNKAGDLDESDYLYQEALRRGVVVYLPQVENGGRPLMRRKSMKKCRDPLKDHLYNAVSWSDQGAFTGDMHTIVLKFYSQSGKRWFNGEKINQDYKRSCEPHLYDEEGVRRDHHEYNSEESDTE